MEHLTVTCVKRIRGFLQIYGHKKPDLLFQLDSEISAYQPSIKSATARAELHPNLEFDTIYLAYTADTNRYHRCIVREKRPNNKAIIELIDYGSDFEVDTSLLLELDPKNKKAEFLKEFPTIATKYMLANFFCNWKLNELSVIESMMTRADLPITNEQIDREHRFISLSYNGIDLATKFINSGIGMEISFTEQRMEVRKIFSRSYDVFSVGPAAASPARREKCRNLVPNRPLQAATNNNTITNQGKRMIQSVVLSNKPNSQRGAYPAEITVTDGSSHSVASRIPAFTANELAVGQFHLVCCSYIEDGPNLFWVHLKSQEHALDRMASELANAPRTQIKTKLSIGMACIARFSEDRALYRAVIQSVQAEGCRVTFIDYGNSEFVPFSELYAIPNQFLEYKTFAMSFQLHGCKELGVLSDHLKAYFKSFVDHDNLLDLKVIPSNNVQVQQCELFISNGLNILNLLKEKQNELSSFPSAPQLKDGDMVVIRAALTAKKFFVQRIKDIRAFDDMMDALLAHCVNAPQMSVAPQKGVCCAAMVNGDNKEWYRAIVLDILDSQRVQVQFVDYGNEMECRLSDLRDITPKFMDLARQAIECCLIDFEDVTEVSETTSKQLCMLIDDTNGEPIEYKASVRRRLPNGAHIVDLYNAARELSVSISMYRLAMPRRHHNNKPTKATNEPEKPTRSVTNGRTNLPNLPNVRECDGAENQERFHEANPNGDRQKDRFSGNNKNSNDDTSRYERAKPTKPRNENPKNVSNGSPKNYANRPDFDSRRNGDANKSVDKNDNWDSTAGESSSDFLSTDLSSKVNNKPTFAPITTEDFVGFNPSIPDAIPFPLNSSTKMNFIHWISPFEFFMQLKSMESKFEEMMHQIQHYYRKRAPIQRKIPIGSLVLVRHRDDSVIKRARIIDYNEQRDKYRVQFIDYGNKTVCVLLDMFELEKAFIRWPAMAICCTLEPAILNKPLSDVLEKVAQYFNYSADIECKKVRQDKEKSTVDVHINGNNLRDLLIRENFLINLPKDICLERLVGQTLMAYITAVTDLNRFHAMFYGCDIAFMCSYKDLSLVKKNPKLSEHLRAAEKKQVRVKVESISTDNVLMLSIYLPQLDKAIDLPEICNYPIYNNEFSGIVSHIEPPFTVYIQNSAYHEPAQQLLNNLYDAYVTDGTVCRSPSLNQTYVAVSRDDDNYYRCRIERILGDDELEVRFIDYGNTEVIKMSSLKVLADTFKAPISALAQKMVIPVKMFNGTILDLDWNIEPRVKILGTYHTHFVCDLIANGTSMISALEKNQQAKKIELDQLDEFAKQMELEQESVVDKSSATAEHACEKNDVNDVSELETPAPADEIVPFIEAVAREEVAAPMELALENVTKSTAEMSMTDEAASCGDIRSERELAFITHVDHPNRFYMQLNSDSDALDSFQQSLQIVAPQLPALTEFRVGQLCIGKYSYDDQWYRAKIIDTDGEITSIQFIDYGNTDSITDNSLLKTPPNQHSDNTLTRKTFALACSLPIEPRGSSDWVESACEKLRMLMNDSPLEFEVISQDKDVHYVKIFLIGGRDIVKELIQEGVADPLEIIPSGETCFVSHINSLSDFFIQMDSDTDVLHKIELHLEQNSDAAILLDPNAGTICSAQFEDNRFYRARILRAVSAGYEVEFLDYGNTFVTTDVRSLMPEIAQLPHLRRRCTLKLPHDIQSWSEQAEQRFRDVSGDGATEFKVHLIKPGKKACVALYMGDNNLSDVLSELCEKRPASPIVVDEQENTFNENTSSHSINVNDFPSGSQSCLIAHANGPSDFYIHFSSKIDDLRSIAAELERAVEHETLNQNNIEIGSIVAAQFPDDGYYYRAKVLSVSENGTNVHFIDYGNTCVVEHMRKLPSIISTIVPMAANCTLASDQLMKFTPADINRFMNFMCEEPEPTFQVQAISTSVTKSTVQLYRDGVEILDYIREMESTQDAIASTVLSDIIEEATSLSIK